MSSHSDTIVYSAEKSNSLSQLFLGIFKGFSQGHGLGKRLFIRDTRATYRQSALGLLWVIIIPLAQTMVWVFLSNGGVLNIGETGVPYPIYVLTGVLLWRSLTDAVNAPLMMFNSSKSILSKINFPKEALIITAFYKVMFNLGINLLVRVPLFIYYGIVPGWTALWGFIALIPIILFGLSVGVLITPFGALFIDVQKFIQSFMQLFFFLTPIIYPMPKEGFIASLSEYNPAAICIVSTRDMLLETSDQLMDHYGVFLLSTLIIGTLGLLIYRISLPIIIERSGS